jgi:hypothetical protein
VDDQLIARFQFAQVVGDAVVVRIDLDGEFQVIPLGQTGEGEGSFFILHFWRVDGNVCRLAGHEAKASGSFQRKSPNVMRNRFYFQDVDDGRFHGVR